MSSIDLIDDLEAGELSVEFEGQEPWELLEWAIERFGEGLALSTAFQEGDVALIDMAYRHRPDRSRLLDRHRPTAPGDARPRRAAPRALRRPAARVPLPGRGAGATPRRPPRAEPLLPLRREPDALLQRPQGAATDPRPRRPRRLGDGPPARPVGVTLGHPQDRDRPRPRRDREAQPARRVVRGRGLGVPPRERRADATRSTRRATRRSAASPAHDRSPKASPSARAAGGGRRAPRRSAACTARSRRAGSSTSSTPSSGAAADE